MVTPLHRKLLRDIRRYRAQFVAITITIFLGVTIFGASYDSFQNLNASYETTATEYRFANLTAVGGDTAAIVAAAESQPVVESVETRTSIDVPFLIGDTKLLGRAVGIPGDSQPKVNQLEVLSGSYLDPSEENGVLVEEHMADHFELARGAHHPRQLRCGVSLRGVDPQSGRRWTQRGRDLLRRR